MQNQFSFYYPFPEPVGPVTQQSTTEHKKKTIHILQSFFLNLKLSNKAKLLLPLIARLSSTSKGKPDNKKPEANKPESGKPDSQKTELNKPEVQPNKSEAKKSESSKPDAAKADTGKPDTGKTELKKNEPVPAAVPKSASSTVGGAATASRPANVPAAPNSTGSAKTNEQRSAP
jgi:hypothetical protein